jgi:probable addiction module antidote protein
MPNNIKINELPLFDMAEQLQTDEDVSTYLSLVLEEGDTDELIRAIGYVAKARGMSQIARDTGLGRESLYKSFKEGAKPQFDTVIKVLHAINIDLKAVAQPHEQANQLSSPTPLS